MLVVIDTNVIISGLLVPTSKPAKLIALWRNGKFDIVTSPLQIEELTRVTRYPKIKDRLQPVLAGRLINEFRELAVMVNYLPVVDISPDPYDNYLLAMASEGVVHYLITGDKRDLLALKKYKETKIISVRDFLLNF
jgi:uncharacterized protein